ncbi:MAG: hypothetical protein GF398_04995 [Chitinivibrionales bacterium]|nr:hypothetical protein [Chitinivibrionales bacterium]
MQKRFFTSFCYMLVVTGLFTRTAALNNDLTDDAGNWIDLSFPGSLQISDAGTQGIKVINSGKSLSVAKHDSSLTDFIYTATITPLSSTFSNAGIAFCLSDSWGGYYFEINSNQEYSLFKFTPSASNPTQLVSQVLAFLPTSNINKSGANTLKVHKHGSTISLFCNGQFLKSFTDSEYATGNIGLLVPKQDSVTCKDAIISTGSPAQTRRTCFSDDFADGNLVQWYYSAPGMVAANSSGSFSIENPDSFNTAGFVNGDFGESSMKATISHQGGRTDKFYGLAFVGIEVTANNSYRFSFLAFVITQQRGVAVVPPGASTIAYRSFSPVTGQTDELEVIFENNRYIYKVNGSPADTQDVVTNLDIVAAGIFMGGPITISVSDFIVAKGSDLACDLTFAGHTMQPTSALRTFSTNQSGVYNLLGRKVPQFSTRQEVSASTPHQLYINPHADTRKNVLLK